MTATAQAKLVATTPIVVPVGSNKEARTPGLVAREVRKVGSIARVKGSIGEARTP